MTNDPLAGLRSLQDLILRLADATGFDLMGFQLSPNPESGGREILMLTFEVPVPESKDDPIQGMIEAMMTQLQGLTEQHNKENHGDD